MPEEAGSPVVDIQELRRSCAQCSLRALCLPGGVERGDLERLDNIVRKPAPVDPDGRLFHAGDRFGSVYVVRSGSLKTVLPVETGNWQVMGFHVPGDVVGLDAISEDRHQCEAIALERTSVCAIPFEQLEGVAAQLPSLQRQLHRIISREIGRDQEHLEALGRRTARERVALFLHGLSRRLERAGFPGSELRLSMSREDIADYLGLALETVSRVMGRLADEGLIKVDRRRVRIRDRDALGRLAGQASNDARHTGCSPQKPD